MDLRTRCAEVAITSNINIKPGDLPKNLEDLISETGNKYSEEKLNSLLSDDSMFYALTCGFTTEPISYVDFNLGFIDKYMKDSTLENNFNNLLELVESLISCDETPLETLSLATKLLLKSAVLCVDSDMIYLIQYDFSRTEFEDGDDYRNFVQSIINEYERSVNEEYEYEYENQHY